MFMGIGAAFSGGALAYRIGAANSTALFWGL